MNMQNLRTNSIPEAGSMDERRRQQTRTCIMSGATAIAANAYSDCEQLIEVNLPDSVRAIFDGAFKNCSALGYIILPDDVQYIGQEAFAGCSNLWEVVYQGRMMYDIRSVMTTLRKNGVQIAQNCFDNTALERRTKTA